MIAITPVMVNWLVTVNGWTPGSTPNGIIPIRLANRMKMKTVNTQGRYFRPSGPMFVSIIEVTKLVMPSTATCQRPGTSSRRMPPTMKTRIDPSTSIIHSALLVKAKGLPARSPAGRSGTDASDRSWIRPPLLSFPAYFEACCEIFQISQIATPKPTNNMTTQATLVPTK